MNVYQMLTKLVEARPWTDEDRRHAVQLIAVLERFHGFGIAGEFEEADHECTRSDVLFPKSVQCSVCLGPMSAPPHTCVPREYGTDTAHAEVRCMICNSDMPHQAWPDGAPAVMMIARGP